MDVCLLSVYCPPVCLSVCLSCLLFLVLELFQDPAAFCLFAPRRPPCHVSICDRNDREGRPNWPPMDVVTDFRPSLVSVCPSFCRDSWRSVGRSVFSSSSSSSSSLLLLERRLHQVLFPLSILCLRVWLWLSPRICLAPYTDLRKLGAVGCYCHVMLCRREGEKWVGRFDCSKFIKGVAW